MHFEYVQYKQKGFAPILILLGIVLLVSVAGGAFYVGKTISTPPDIVPVITPIPKLSPTSVISPTSTINETANWKTTQKTFDNGIKLSFKHPSNWSDNLNSCPNQSGSQIGCVRGEFILGQKVQDIAGSVIGESVTVDGKKAIKQIKDTEIMVGLSRIYTILIFDSQNKPYFGLVVYFDAGTDTKTLFALTKTLDQILSTFKFLDQKQVQNTIKPAESQTPASGVCGGPESAIVASVTLNEDMPIPRCIIVKANQQLEIANNTSKTVIFTLGQNSLSIGPNQKKTITQTFGSYLAPGVHNTKTSLYGGGGPEIWLQ